MANPLYNLNGNQQPVNMLEAFPKFVQQMRGKNPTEMLNNLVSSGRISQQQLNAVQKQAQQMSGMFEQFRNMFK